MDEQLRDSLMAWYLRFGERKIDVTKFMVGDWHDLRSAYQSEYVRSTPFFSKEYKITPEGIEALKNDG